MKILLLKNLGRNYLYKWPEGYEQFEHYLDYVTESHLGKHLVRLGFTHRNIYDMKRQRIMIWVDGRPYAEFISADDFESTGKVVSEIKVRRNGAYGICRLDEQIPARYTMFNIVALPDVVRQERVHKAWAVSTNIADHETMIRLAALRMYELRQFEEDKPYHVSQSRRWASIGT